MTEINSLRKQQDQLVKKIEALQDPLNLALETMLPENCNSARIRGSLATVITVSFHLVITISFHLVVTVISHLLLL